MTRAGLSAALIILSTTAAAQDKFDIATCEANVDTWARDQCLKGIGVTPEPKKKSVPATPNTTQAKPTPAPSTNWKKVAESHLAEANTYCQRPIERLAKYDFEWTDGWMELKLSRGIESSTPGNIIYSGDKIKFQNGFGAWQTYTYFCEYNPSTKAVIDVTATPGRLP